MSNQRRIIGSVIGVAVGTILLVVSAVLAEKKIISPVSAIALVVVSVVLFFVAIFYAGKVDYETGVYECRKCGHIFKPTIRAYIMGAHTLSTRHLTCPECKEKSWCKRKMER